MPLCIPGGDEQWVLSTKTGNRYGLCVDGRKEHAASLDRAGKECHKPLRNLVLGQATNEVSLLHSLRG